MIQHTTQAWEYVPSVPLEGVECYWIRAPKLLGSQGFRMIDVASVNGPQGAEQEAIASLFAAAQELLGALVDALDFVEDATKIRPVGSLEADSAWAVWHRATAAINKARGSQ